MRLGRKQVATAESVPEDNPVPAALGRISLSGDPTADSLALREEFHIQLIELANQFDDLDHEVGPVGGSDLQDDCQAIRELTRKEMHPRFQAAFRNQQSEILDAQILAGLVAGPDANK